MPQAHEQSGGPAYQINWVFRGTGCMCCALESIQTADCQFGIETPNCSKRQRSGPSCSQCLRVLCLRSDPDDRCRAPHVDRPRG